MDGRMDTGALKLYDFNAWQSWMKRFADCYPKPQNECFTIIHLKMAIHFIHPLTHLSQIDWFIHPFTASTYRKVYEPLHSYFYRLTLW